jgi:hypothetical protein
LAVKLSVELGAKMLDYGVIQVICGWERQMRTMLIAAGFALLCAVTSPVHAADMVVKAPKETKVAAEPVCLRWVQQNYSWYNYCDSIPYYPRATRFWWQGL